MFVRGSGFGDKESRREDNSFYRGIVVKNNDPEGRNRIKIYIAELTNQPFEEWLGKYTNFSLKAIGENVNKDEQDPDNPGGQIGKWKDTKIFEEICKPIPWAEPCYPIMGESGSFRYYKEGKLSTISDCNYVAANDLTKPGNSDNQYYGFNHLDDNTPTPELGVFAPAFLYDYAETLLHDPFDNPIKNYTVQCNPYSYCYSPSKHVHKPKGVMAVPEVGAKVWVFHSSGDLNFPVYFGTAKDGRNLESIKDITKRSGDFEN